ncbi:unnamed protein product [Cochlearia groenlandica]
MSTLWHLIGTRMFRSNVAKQSIIRSPVIRMVIRILSLIFLEKTELCASEATIILLYLEDIRMLGTLLTYIFLYSGIKISEIATEMIPKIHLIDVSYLAKIGFYKKYRYRFVDSEKNNLKAYIPDIKNTFMTCVAKMEFLHDLGGQEMPPPPPRALQQTQRPTQQFKQDFDVEYLQLATLRDPTPSKCDAWYNENLTRFTRMGRRTHQRGPSGTDNEEDDEESPVRRDRSRRHHGATPPLTTSTSRNTVKKETCVTRQVEEIKESLHC